MISTRFNGTFLAIIFQLNLLVTIGPKPLVGNGPGAIAFERIPYFAHSTARLRVMAKTPAFASTRHHV
jgi:hypothetical protein